MSENTGLSRRTLAKGAAWAAPAVAFAAAAPMAAASPIITVSQAGVACKLPGNSCAPTWSKGYLQPLKICNNSTQSVTITITEPAVLTFNGTPKRFEPTPSSFTLTSKGCQVVVLNINLQDSSQQSSIYGTLNWTYVAADGQTGSGTTEIATPQTPPCVDCKPTTPTQAARAAASAEATASEATPEPTKADTNVATEPTTATKPAAQPSGTPAPEAAKAPAPEAVPSTPAAPTAPEASDVANG